MTESVRQLSNYTRLAKYALYRPEDRRRETWPEQVARVFDQHRTFYGDRLSPIMDLVDRAEQAMLDQRALGSQRALQFGGAPILKHHARQYNCTTSHCNRPRAFQEAFFLLMCGCGVGVSFQRHHVAMLPKAQAPAGETITWVIEDSIEGWADALGVLLSSYFVEDQPFPEVQGRVVLFDFSQIRPRGAPISTGAKAPGPGPLRRALQRIRLVMDRVVGAKGEHVGNTFGHGGYQTVWGLGLDRMRPLDAYDVLMHASDAVLAGGQRRSASIALFSPDDEEMLSAKSFEGWLQQEPQRQRSNNSVVLVRGETTRTQFAQVLARTRAGWGEPGILWTDSREMVVNPCGEAGMWPALEVYHRYLDYLHIQPGSWSGVSFPNNHGDVVVSGWQMCNLSTINGSAIRTVEDFLAACEAAAVLGTLQAGYTRFPYLGPVSEQIVAREALLGVSITGMVDCPLLFDPDVLRQGAQRVLEVNAEVAHVLGIEPAARSTLIKPEGKSSLLLGTFGTGIHPWHSKRGIRYVRASTQEAPFQWYAKHNPHAVHRLPQTDADHETTRVLAFAYEAPEDALTRNEVDAFELLRRVQLVQRSWVQVGRRPEQCTQPWLTHNVSNTLTVGERDWEGLEQALWDARHDLAGISLMGAYSDKAYALAPYTEVLTPDEQVARFGEGAVAFAHPLLDLLDSLWDGDLWDACAARRSTSPGWRTRGASWVGAAESFRDVWFDGDWDAAELCLKEVESWRRFQDLQARTVPVDWTAMREGEDAVDFMANEGACDGLSCEWRPEAVP